MKLFFAPALAVAFCLPASAINLVFTDTTSAANYPNFDPDGSRLAALVTAAESVWQDIIEDAGTLEITYSYAAITGLANGTATATSGGKPTKGHINVSNDETRTWYFDPTPTNNSEYEFTQRLFQDLTATQQSNWFSSTPPALLEVSYRGLATASAPADARNGFDMFTTFLHEVGHVLGLSSTMAIQEARDSGGTFGAGDFDFDVPSSFANGNFFSVLAAGTDPNDTNQWGHIAAASFMCNSCAAVGLRRLPAATDILAIAAASNWTTIDLPRQDFLPRQGTGSGSSSDFNNASNWEGNQVPGAADEAFLRLGTLVGGGAGMNVNMTANANVHSLFLSDATDLLTGPNRLDVGRTATIEFDGDFPFPQIFVQTSGELEAEDMVINGGELDMAGGLADIQDDLTLTADTLGRVGAITGAGTVDVAGRLTNDGRITATNEDGPTLTFTSAGATPWDLDGLTGNGEVFATAGNISFASGALSDSFNGTFRVDDPHTLTIAAPWTLSAGGVIDLNGGEPNLSATFAGGLISATSGSIQASGLSRISAPLTVSGSAAIQCLATAGTDRLELLGALTISGGTVSVAGDSVLQINASSTLSGGNFSIAAGGIVNLGGSHSLSGGTYSGGGELSFNGTTTIAGPVTVDCTTLDFDGGGAIGKIVNINSVLTINSTQLDVGDNIYNSTLNFGTSSGELIVNGPANWRMAGIMNVNTGTLTTLSSVTGAPFIMSGTTHANQSTRWDAVATITGTINIANSHRLSLNGGDTGTNPNRINGGTVNGPGNLRSTTNSALVGYGTINANIDFLSDCLLQADNGTLTLAGTFTSVPGVIGTADSDGVLDVINSWTLPAGRILKMNGGTVTGQRIDNQGVISGHGFLTAVQINNNGTISATDGLTLVIDTDFNPDLDGFTPTETHALNAVSGNIKVVDPVSDAFDGILNVAASREIDFNQGWTLGSSGVLNLAGGASNSDPAKLRGLSHTFRGATTCTGETQLFGPATFGTSSGLGIPGPTDRLRLFSNTAFDSGATVTGAGTLVGVGGTLLLLPDEIIIEPDLTLAGSLELGGAAGAQVTLGDYEPTSLAILNMDLNGTPAQPSLNDHITSVKSVTLAGALKLRFTSANLTLGQRWTILSAPSVSGSFSSVSTSGLSGQNKFRVVVTSSTVDVILIQSESYGNWVARNGLIGADALVTTDIDGDGIQNGVKYALGLDPKLASPLPEVSSVNVSGTDFLSITARIHTLREAPDATLGATRSTGLDAFSNEQVLLQSSVLDDATQIRTKVWRSALPLGSIPREFLRVEALITP